MDDCFLSIQISYNACLPTLHINVCMFKFAIKNSYITEKVKINELNKIFTVHFK